jgi:hypothetical protein
MDLVEQIVDLAVIKLEKELESLLFYLEKS